MFDEAKINARHVKFSVGVDRSDEYFIEEAKNNSAKRIANNCTGFKSPAKCQSIKWRLYSDTPIQ